MRGGTSERAWAAAAALAALPVLLAPVGDPDLWWHLSAADWIAAHGNWPRADWLSFTRAGEPWADFEWLAQLAFRAVYGAAGLAGLWVLKAALLAVAGAVVWALLSRRGLPPPARAAAVGLWVAAMVPRADIRAELFSLAGFAWLLCLLETRWDAAARGGERWRRAAACAALFALWANLHGGFAYGLLLLALYAARDALGGGRRGLALCAASGVAGALLNPYGAQVYAVLARHGREAGALTRYIMEWGPLSLGRPGHWPTWALLAAAAALLARRWRRERRAPLWELLLLGAFAVPGLRHARLAAYFATLACALMAARAPVSARAASGALALCAAFGLWTGARAGVFRRVAHAEYLPVRAAAYLERSEELRGLRLYHPWGWGGYLGYRLAPRTQVFQDGRYIFHELLLEGAEAIRAPSTWQDFLAQYGVNAALMENAPLSFPTERVYPDGSRKAFARPYYLGTMPREAWALVYWDEKALLFVRRGALAQGRLARLEYSLARPGDEAALADALARGEIDRARWEAELARHERELAALPKGL